MTAARPRRSLTDGLSALIKASILAFGVPIAIGRLWFVAGSLRGTAPVVSDALWIRGVLVVVSLLWCRVLIQLLVDLRSALHGTPLTPLDWSSRWATSIAALAILVSAGHVAGGHPHKAPTAINAVRYHAPAPNPFGPGNAGQLRPGECLADVAARVFLEPEQWSVLAAANMGRLVAPQQRFVDPSLVRSEWCLSLPLSPVTLTGDLIGEELRTNRQAAGSHRAGERNVLEELAWLSLGVLGTAAFVRRLQTLRVAARAARLLGERLARRDSEIESLEARLDPFGDAVLIDWIEAANRLLRRATLELGIEPVVQLVRAGPSGVTFYFESAPELESRHFVIGDDGFSWTLSLQAPLERAVADTSGAGRYAPWLIPVGDDGEDAWLVAVGPAQSLVIDSDQSTTEEVLRGITTALRTLPWAEELSVELLGLEPPPMAENCYQMASSSSAAIADLASDPPAPRAAEPSAAWRREPLIVSRFADEASPISARINATAGVVRPGREGSIRLSIDKHGARLTPVGVSLNVPRPDERSGALIERLLAGAASLQLVTPLPRLPRHADRTREPLHLSRHVISLKLLGAQPSADGLRGDVSDRDRLRVVELLGFIALHDGPATQLEIMTALFPRAGADAYRRLDIVLVATSRALGGDRLVVAGNGTVMVDATLRTDWVDLLEELARAKTGDAVVAAATLGRVLDGGPWRPGAPFRWMRAAGLIDHLCFEICDAMHDLAQLASTAGDLELATRSIRAGLELEPTSELLVRDLMVLEHQRDDAAGVTAAYSTLEAALGEIGGVEPSWATRALFEELAGVPNSSA